MQFTYYMPTELVAGRDCVVKQGEKMKALGKSAFIVTGKSSAKNGALSDVITALENNGQTATVYDRITPNPSVAEVREGVTLLKSAEADFVIGIGGGSPMDAAKAIAALAVQDRADEHIFDGGYENVALPIVQIPTTAGTGSEVTPNAVLTNDLQQTKMSIASPAMRATLAYLDGKYMENLNRTITVNTAIDALSHAVEGMLSRAAIALSDLYAEEAIRILYPLLAKADREALTLDDRDTLLYASTLAGMTISCAGTTAVHSMGYSLTYFYGIDHGRANGILLGETLRLCKEKGLPQVERILKACGLSDVEELCSTLSALLKDLEDIPEEALCDFTKRVMPNKNIKKSAYEPTEEEVKKIFFRSFGRAI